MNMKKSGKKTVNPPVRRIGKRRIEVPSEISLKIKIPLKNKSEEAMRKYMIENYHIDIDLDPESDYYEHLFYNEDLRSMMGIMHDYNPGTPSTPGELWVTLFPKYYVDADNPDSYWTKRWLKLLKNSRVTKG